MRLIGRQLCLAFTPNSNICITKLVTNHHNLSEKQAVIFDVFHYDSELLYRFAGEPIYETYGKDLNALVSDNGYWCTRSEPGH